MNLEELTQKALKREGYDGLYNIDGECACKTDDLFPCECPSRECRPGYLTPCDGSCETGNCNYHIQPFNPSATELLGD